ncbi:MAG TPA: DUF1684 domain-containing protein [Flavobacterium sp.]
MKNLLLLLIMLSIFRVSAQQKFDPASVAAFQNELNSQYADTKKSPLMASDLKTFKHLDFFPADSAFFVTAKLVKAKKQKPFKMKTSTDRLPMYVKYGTLYFELQGKKCELNLYQNAELIKKPGFDDYLFLPFSDLTNGKESYIGGRYIDVRSPKGDTIVIDFNKAYNPYCAYNHAYSCPIVPLENDLPVEVRAGVKAFHE